jgi:hypothetical protein
MVSDTIENYIAIGKTFKNNAVFPVYGNTPDPVQFSGKFMCPE